MNNRFTFDYYKKLMTSIIENDYKFIFFNEIKNYNELKYVILRHDIDFDIVKALKFANLEYELGIKSTYFFLLNSEFYNINNIKNTIIINKIIEMGHRVSIHFDVANYPSISNDQLLHHISKEISFFKDLFNININIISFHRPDENVLMEKITLNINHTYMPKYSRSIKYLSDSKKKMPEGDLIEIMQSNKYKQMQLLIHPIWWNEHYSKPQFDYESYLNKKLKSLKHEIVLNSKIYKRSNDDK